MEDSPSTRPSLLLRIRDLQDSQAWSQFVEIYSPLVYRLMRRRGLQDADAADVTQDAFRTVARSIKDFRGGSGRGSFRSWLIAIARTRLSDFLARRKRQAVGSGDTRVQEFFEEQPSAEEEEESFEREYRQRVLRWAADQIRIDFQESTWQAFWQTNVEGKDTRQVAESLGMTVGAVYIARSRVLARLKKEVQRMQMEE